MKLLEHHLYGNVVNELQNHGEVSDEHAKELKTLCAQFGRFVEHKEVKKVVCEMQTGMGKTTCVLQLIKTLHEREITYPILVSVPDTDTLALMAKTLCDWHIPVGKVFSSSTVEGRDFPYKPTSEHKWKEYSVLLACNQRINKMRTDSEELLVFKDGRKRLVIHDETPALGTISSCYVKDLKSDLELLREWLSDESVNKIEDLIKIVNDCHADAKARGADIVSWRCLTVPEILKREVKDATNKLSRERTNPETFLYDFLLRATDGVRVTEMGLLSYKRIFPSIDQLIVLDASWKYSALSRLCPDISPMGLGNAKHYKNVEVVLMQKHGGVDAIRKDICKVKEFIADAERKYGALLLISKKLFSTEFGKVIDHPDSRVLRWGKHTASNLYSNLENIVCIGLLRMKRKDVLAKAMVFADSLMAEDRKDGQQNTALVELYQGVSRGRSRQTTVIDGVAQALPSKIIVYDLLDDEGIKQLQDMLPGCSVRFESPDDDDLKRALDAFGAEKKMSMKEFRKRLGWTGLHSDTWSSRIWPKLEPAFGREGRSIVRLS